tara:strand:+ start:201 stop:404 length:204 start_codon:yes stop_codon:yes gene_type:complete
MFDNNDNGITFSFREIENGFLVSWNKLSENHLKPREHYCFNFKEIEDLSKKLTKEILKESIEPEDGE